MRASRVQVPKRSAGRSLFSICPGLQGAAVNLGLHEPVSYLPPTRSGRHHVAHPWRWTDLAGSNHLEPERVRGIDGKSYPSRREPKLPTDRATASRLYSGAVTISAPSAPNCDAPCRSSGRSAPAPAIRAAGHHPWRSPSIAAILAPLWSCSREPADTVCLWGTTFRRAISAVCCGIRARHGGRIPITYCQIRAYPVASIRYQSERPPSPRNRVVRPDSCLPACTSPLPPPSIGAARHPRPQAPASLRAYRRS